MVSEASTPIELTHYHINNFLRGHLGGSVSYASAFGLGHDPRVLGSSPALGSLLSGESASPSACVSASLSLSVSLMNK